MYMYVEGRFRPTWVDLPRERIISLFNFFCIFDAQNRMTKKFSEIRKFPIISELAPSLAIAAMYSVDESTPNC